jgi:pimeloyl-ACP methyl ester carboxylesterase
MAMPDREIRPSKIQESGDMPVLGRKRILNTLGDPPDIRDRMYEPALVRLKSSLENREPKLVLDQGSEGACTGFGLAAVINLLKFRAGQQDFRASTRMLYEMAKKHDEWPGEQYDGSSCRGAIRGWHNMGVCKEVEWPYKQTRAKSDLTIERAIAARRNTLGAYYRLQAEVVDYHAALNETGAIYVSANVHDGWSNPSPRKKDQLPRIKHHPVRTGGHAFAIVGYDAEGFIVQNSWGQKWGREGFALWTYEDWLENIMDGWVFRLAVPTPQIFGLVPTSTDVAHEVEESGRTPVKRVDIEGHFVHFDDGRYKERGNYWSTHADVKQTAARVTARPDRYRHLMIYAHGGLNSPGASARRVQALKDGFKRNGIYPYHIMYDTGLAEELKDIIKRALGFAQERAGAFTDWTDGIIEDAVRKPVTLIWEEMKSDAKLPFEKKNSDGARAIQALAEALVKTDKKIHLVGHSTGGVLLGYLLRALDRLGRPNLVASCSLMAPACTIEFYKKEYEPRLGRGGRNSPVVRLPKLTIYNLSEKLEEDDNVAKAYRKSLLFLVSRALERARHKPILGMQIYSKALEAKPGLELIYSDGQRGPSQSSSHGGFDNDENTMNDILKTILGRPAKQKNRFKHKEMRGY